MENYRPISLLPVISKVFEKAFCSRIVSFLTDFDVLCESQYGFRRKRSTTNAVCELYLNIVNAFLANECLLATFIDFTKAFDTIDHKILLEKLPAYGIRGCALGWIRSYLSKRTMLVSTQCNLSREITLNHYGVPQGSNLGPLLYIIYANDLPTCLTHTQAIFYADDTTIFLRGRSHTELARLMNIELEHVQQWCNANSLAINATKTKCILFSASSRPHSDMCLSIGGQAIEFVPNFKFLGILVDERLSWKPHINELQSKLSRGLWAIRRVKHLVSYKGMLALYHALVHCHLVYGCLLWGSASENALKPLYILQKKAIRTIHNAHYNAHSAPLFAVSNVLPISSLIKFEIGKFIYLHVNSTLPHNLSLILNTHAHSHGHHTRNNLLYRPPRITSATISKNLISEANRIYSTIPQPTLTLSFNAFKKVYKIDLFRHTA